MKKILRLLFRLPQPKIRREVAIDIAKKYFNKENIRIGQLKVIEEMRSWFIWSNANVKPSPWVRIDNQKGNIKDSGKPLR